MKQVCDLLIDGIGLLVTPSAPGPHAGPDAQGALEQTPDAAVAIAGETIVAVGKRQEVVDRFDPVATVSAEGRGVTPGLVDPHTHLVFAGDRSFELEPRLRGESYAAIAMAGGGIRATVRATREASFEDLAAGALVRLRRLASGGCTTVEVKSGYGLDLETERRMLEVAGHVAVKGPVDLVVTNLAAHEIPDEFRDDREAFISLVVDRALPELRDLSEFADVFCEPHVFTVDESRRILTRARDLGYRLKIHADEIEASGGAELAAELGAVSADHLGAISEAGIQALADTQTVAVLLPGTALFLQLDKRAPGRALVDAGVPVALATDCNPGSSPCDSLPLCMSLACLENGLTPAEALVAATANAAAALGRGDRGAVAPGLRADLVVWDVQDWRGIMAHLGTSLARLVIAGGVIVHQAGPVAEARS